MACIADGRVGAFTISTPLMTLATLSGHAPVRINRRLTHTLTNHIGGLACDAGLEPVAWVIWGVRGTDEPALNAIRPAPICQLIFAERQAAFSGIVSSELIE
jgi:hypothetical protein